jgi:hypothetical protein
MKNRDFPWWLPIIAAMLLLAPIVLFTMALEATKVDPKEGTKVRLQAIRSLLEKADKEGILIEQTRREEIETKVKEIENKLESADNKETYEEAGEIMRKIRKIVYPDSNEIKGR